MPAATVPIEPMILLAIGGDPALPVAPPPTVPEGSVVVAADSGLDRLVVAGLPVHHVVGDLDSASPASVDVATAEGAVVHRHPADKDATDIELALSLIAVRIAPATGLRDLLVVGSGGGRFDHLLADVLALTAPGLAALTVTARIGEAAITVVRPAVPRAIAGRPGEQVSLLPVHGPATGVATEGLRWPLVDADLVVGTTRAMSNELIATRGTVQIASGVVAVVQPGSVAPPIPARTTPYDPTPRARPASPPGGAHR